LSIPFEILVYDDCSSESHIENLKIQGFKHTKYKTLKKNIGRSAIRNQLAKDATYETLLFLDADVLPKNDSFIKSYLEHINHKIICGGVDYKKENVSIQERLRYTYGIHREVKNLKKRNEEPYFIVSANLYIEKETYLKINSNLLNFYGSDLVLSENIKKSSLKVLHIDNPIYHLGLESSDIFLSKSKKLQYTITKLEQEGSISKNLTGIQRVYHKLNRLRIANLSFFVLSIVYPLIKKQLKSNTPFLFSFDLYKLHNYMKSKKNA